MLIVQLEQLYTYMYFNDARRRGPKNLSVETYSPSDARAFTHILQFTRTARLF